MYSLIYSKEALKDLNKLNWVLKKRIISTLERCQVRPYSHIKKLVGSPYFRLRIGDYRLILDVQDGKLIILVLELGHRKGIYKK